MHVRLAQPMAAAERITQPQEGVAGTLAGWAGVAADAIVGFRLHFGISYAIRACRAESLHVLARGMHAWWRDTHPRVQG